MEKFLEEFRDEYQELKLKLFGNKICLDLNKIPDSFDKRRIEQLLGFFCPDLRDDRWVDPMQINVRDLSEDYYVIKPEGTQMSLDWVKGFNEFLM